MPPDIAFTPAHDDPQLPKGPKGPFLNGHMGPLPNKAQIG
jgi:hypothetical protein